MKPKICKRGINKAKDFDGCGKETFKLTFGLCDSCLYDFYTTDERGKVIFEKRKLKVKQTKDKAFKSDLRQKLKTLSDYEAEAKKVFQKYVRLRDSGLNCISCNNPNPKDWSGGHYFPAGVYSGLIFDERNCHAQCNSYCNMYLSGNLSAYRIGLVNRYGREFVEQLEADSIVKRNYKYTKEELIDIKNLYSAKIKEITN
jgi:hypothetical protein